MISFHIIMDHYSDIKNYRVTVAVIAFLIGVFAWSPVTPTQAVIVDNSLWQTIINNFVHLHRFHICMNLIAFISFRSLEDKLGHLQYAVLLGVLLVLKTLIYSFCLADHYQASFGFSGVIFALLTIYPSDNLMGIALDRRFYPVALLFLMQLIPNSSFYGHLSGIVAGYLYKEGSGIIKLNAEMRSPLTRTSSPGSGRIENGVLRQRRSRLI